MRSPVLAWDELLGTLTPADAKAWRASVPVGLRDQFDAAATVALRATTTEMSWHGAGPPHRLRHADIPEWLRLSALDELVGFVRRTADTCLHAPDPLRPEPVVAAAWKPGLVTCWKCVHLFRLAGAADRTCDRCGHVCAGLPEDGITMGRLLFGPLIYNYGLCTGCLIDDGGPS